jgi:hypothetical protein
MLLAVDVGTLLLGWQDSLGTDPGCWRPQKSVLVPTLGVSVFARLADQCPYVRELLKQYVMMA